MALASLCVVFQQLDDLISGRYEKEFSLVEISGLIPTKILVDNSDMLLLVVAQSKYGFLSLCGQASFLIISFTSKQAGGKKEKKNQSQHKKRNQLLTASVL